MTFINIFGSTGIIGKKNLDLIKRFFPKIQVNLLLANYKFKELADQARLFNANYVCIKDDSKYKLLLQELADTNIKVIHHNEILDFIKTTNSDMTILSVSGNVALEYIEPIIINTKFLGLVNKECIVAAGNIINKLCLKYSTKLFAIDSEHYSIQNFFDRLLNIKIDDIKNIYLTASGGPFLNKKFNDIKNASFEDAIQHPKWHMGIKNSIDSATLVNKCLEVIEAHYLFNIEYKKLNILIHPEALVHSIIEYKNYTSFLNYFYHDMDIPLFNFLNLKNNNYNYLNINSNFNFNKNSSLNFIEPSLNNFPILQIFNQLDKTVHSNIIKFNSANELAVNLFARKMIKFSEIYNIIEKSLNLDVNFEVNSINNILIFQDIFINKIKIKFNLTGG